jgi:Zn-dependent oligopeptidase
MALGYTDPTTQQFVEASSVKLGAMLRTDESADRRRAAWEGLKSIETHVLDHGFIDVLRRRNELARTLGGEDYYDWKVRRVEGMSKADIFELLDELEEKTRASGRQAIAALREQHGNVDPWNVPFLISGDVTTAQDPHFPFGEALERWGKSFAALGVTYDGAELVLDLVDRKGKYENGFMHGPVPAWRDGDQRRPARVHFTANAIPGMVGSGRHATETLFHEGGHAAHFANIDMPAPCFAQEFAPTSVAFAETQSMFLESIIRDADWQTRYAKTRQGTPMPFALIERGLRAQQPFAAWWVRAMLVVPYVERALYELSDSELSKENVLSIARETESRLLFLEDGGPRPTLSIPHLLSGESSAYYHGYVMAEMGVQQTRQYFLKRDGHLVDNPKVGPELKKVYWQPGNQHSFGTFIERLTGEKVSAVPLANHVNRSADEAVAQAREAIETLSAVPEQSGEPALGASIRVVHGQEVVADTAAVGFNAAARSFSRWIEAQAVAS